MKRLTKTEPERNFKLRSSAPVGRIIPAGRMNARHSAERIGMQASSQVALVYCEQYQWDEIRRAVRSGLDLLGGVERFVRSQEKF